MLAGAELIWDQIIAHFLEVNLFNMLYPLLSSFLKVSLN